MTHFEFSVQAQPSAAMRPPRSRLYPWYDSAWLDSYSRARQLLRSVRPGVLDEFEEAMNVFRTRADFAVRKFQPLLDQETIEKIREVIKGLAPSDFELHEAQQFRRLVVHDHPYFSALQETLVSLVSEAAGEPVEAHYNFLSLYTSSGVCPVHMDSPDAKWTLDLCVNQSEAWPIWFSQVQPWPDVDASEPQAWTAGEWQRSIRQSAAVTFTPQSMEPGEALLFSGSSQWHYRDAMPARNANSSCDLLFFHFIPAGCRELVVPANWARLFDVPELVEIGAALDPAATRANVPEQVAGV